MNKDILIRKEVCPICGQETEEPYYKASSFRVSKVDYDLYRHYKTINPLLYEARFCNHCGYANTVQLFNKPTENEAFYEALYKLNWKGWEIPEEYSPEFAIRVHKLILLNKKCINSKKYGEIAIIALRLYWLYKLVGNEEEMSRFRRMFIEYIDIAYNNEEFPVGNSLELQTACYLMGVFLQDEGETAKSRRWLGYALQCLDLKPYMRERIIEFKNIK